MFYSHTFLARKGPLGTVWCAAHLQNRLRKPHYIATDISSTVDRILFPEFPIALRLSGHLLLGVVRIYSKKVDYLQRDCEIVLSGVKRNFPSTEQNLPKVSRSARIQDVTVPVTLELENMDFDNELQNEGGLDVHIRCQEEINLPEQIPVETDPFVSRSFHEDASGSNKTVLPRTAPMEEENSTILETEHPGPTPMEKEISQIPADQQPGSVPMEGVVSSIPLNRNTAEEPLRDINLMESNNDMRIENDVADIERHHDSPRNINEIETSNDLRIENSDARIEGMLSASPDALMRNFSESDDTRIVIPKPVVSVDQSNSRKDIDSSGARILRNLRDSTLQHYERQRQSPLSFENSDDFYTHTFAPTSDNTQILPSPDLPNPPTTELQIHASPPSVGLQNRRREKRKFDAKTVLSNGYIKKAIDDPSDICRVKRMRPSSALDAWKFNNILRKEDAFDEIRTTGACMDLQNLFKKDFILSKSRSTVLEDDFSDHNAHASFTLPDVQGLGFGENFSEQNAHPTSHVLVSEVAPSHIHETEAVTRDEIAIEDCNRTANVPDPNSLIAPCIDNEFGDPEPSSLVHSSQHIRDYTGSETVNHVRIIAETDIPPPAFQEPSPGTSYLEEHLREDNFFANLNFDKSAESADELDFLEADNNTITGCGSPEEIHALSARTRAAARYLRRLSPKTPGQ